MKLNAKTVIACKIVISLKGGRRLTAKKIAEETGKTPKSLEDSLVALVKAGIIIGKKGCKGGYILVKENITLLDIIDATEGTYFTCHLLLEIRTLLKRYGPENGV